MHPFLDQQLGLTRRQFFGSTGVRLGGMGLGLCAASSLRGEEQADPARMHPPIPGLPNFAAKAQNIIYLHMNGGPAQVDLWDYKPNLAEYFDKDLPDSIRQGQRITTMTSGQTRLPVAPSMFKFQQHGQCGTWVSELLPHTAKCVDDIAVVRSIHTNAINHDPACTFVMTGSEVPGKPSLGSWLSYGLGSVSNDLPSFVVLTPTWKSGAAAQALFTRMWSSGFLSSKYTGVALRHVGDPVLYVQNPPGVSPQNRRAMLDTLGELNRRTLEQLGDPETITRIAQYEMAFRMQTSVPELLNVSNEPKSVLDMYGPDVHRPGSYAANCLLARRLAERDVRFVQLFHMGWDHHGGLPAAIRGQCQDTDQATAALIKDLKQRDLLQDTLIVWGGEFGRTVYSQGGVSVDNYGRDHHPRNFTMWFAGGGIKGGQTYGETDDFSYNIVKDPVHIHDLNATALHLLGLDHTRLTYRFQGRDYRLTDIHGNVIQNLLA